MQRINHFVFLLGGVLVPRVTHVALSILAPQATADGRTRLEMQKLETALLLGQLNSDAYCRAVIDILNAPIPAVDLAGAIPQQAALQPGWQALLDDVPAGIALRLVSDYPRPWLDDILANTGLAAYVGASEPVVLADQHLADAQAALIDFLISAQIVTPGSGLWVDHNNLRTAIAIRRGLDASAFNDADQFRRDLRLRSILQ